MAPFEFKEGVTFSMDPWNNLLGSKWNLLGILNLAVIFQKNKITCIILNFIEIVSNFIENFLYKNKGSVNKGMISEQSQFI